MNEVEITNEKIRGSMLFKKISLLAIFFPNIFWDVIGSKINSGFSSLASYKRRT
jgi:hypothetical protein